MTFVPNLITIGTWHCEDNQCQNFYSSTSCDHCPKTRIKPSEHCSSSKKRCQKCKSNFIDSSRSICDTCMISSNKTADVIECYGCQKEINAATSWVPQAKAYLCDACQSFYCKSCGRSDLSLNIEGFCYECQDDYTHKSFCLKCGSFKYVNLHTEVCRNCEEN